MTSSCPPKAEATGSNPVGCTTFPQVSAPSPCLSLQERAGTCATETGTRVQSRYRNRLTWAERFALRQDAYAEQIEQRRIERELADLAAMDAMDPERFGLCYFFATTGGIVKIGYSRSVYQRLSQVRSGNPFRTILAATARGGKQRESYYHRRFAEHREFGEWFALHPDIIAEIDRLRLAEIERINAEVRA